jgi:hypothetical protein
MYDTAKGNHEGHEDMEEEMLNHMASSIAQRSTK